MILAASTVGGTTEAAAQTDEYPATEGVLRITPYAGAGVQLEYLGTVVHVDPWSRGNYSRALPPDVVLVTDTPPDHLDPLLIASLRRPHTRVVVPSAPEDARDQGGADRLRAVADAIVMANGDTLTLPGMGRSNVFVEAVPMYDLIPGEPFHARGEGNGYVVTLGGLRTYLAGVTECTPEMLAVPDVDILFIPMNLPNGRMPPAVAADCARRISPRVVYPYHYRERPIDDFVESLRDTSIDVRLHDFYPPE
jgi:L-ascorbate metabolism protein UlaG (beta-lactamase superfamily)